jgi:hypothetical integral membrane protein (TIGR02206 family)
MENILYHFARDYQGAPFVLFGSSHLISLAIVLLINLSWLPLRRHLNEKSRRTIRIVLAVILLGGESSWHVWMLVTGQWIIQIMLPLWLCSLSVWVSAFMLLKRSQLAYEFLYFMGILGGSMALLTPDMGIYGFPHYRFIEFLMVHGALVTAPLYMTLVEGLRPTWRSLGRVCLIMLPYLGLVTLINFRLGSNYLYTTGKLPTPSLLDWLSPWPYYIPEMVGLALLICVLLYLPFAMKDWRK